MSLLSRLAVQAARAYGILSARSTNVSADYLVVAGGGSGGAAGGTGGGGGGAGGYLTSTATLSTLNTYSITVGAGGAGVASSSNNGSNSSLSGTGLTTITSTGGGGGGVRAQKNGSNGGSGGGGSCYESPTGITGGTGISGQGNNGGNGTALNINASGGGGGAGAAGQSGSGAAGNGGVGLASSISGSSVYYAGGGGGASENNLGGGGIGGNGGGGNGALTTGNAGTANTGGGGGGGGGGFAALGGAGGSGIVIISYTSATPKFVGGTITTSGGKQIHTFTSSGTLSPITPITASYLVVAGGGSGGSAGYGGGGGAGGYQASSTTLYSGATYIVTIGAGGAAVADSPGSRGNNGSNSVVSGTGLTTITSTGGGGGGGGSGGSVNGNSGGSGGGGSSTGTGGAGTSGQGNNGAAGVASTRGGGGGGAGAAATTGDGGNGSASSISGSSVTYAGGGSALGGSTGGTGGGGAAGVSGTTNTGGGGGASASAAGSGSGGSGIVIISYAGSQVFNGGLVTTSGGNTIHTFTSTGALTPLTNNLNNSLRFRSSASAYLNRTPTIAGNQQKFTFSTWLKRGSLDTSNSYTIFAAGTNGSSALDSIEFNTSTGALRVFSYNGAYVYQYITTQVFRDPSAWYHLVVAVDTTQATAGDRIKIYVNGQQVTAFTTSTAPSLNANSAYFNTTNAHYFCKYINQTVYTDLYLTDVNFIDGQQLEPYYFGNNDANGVWKPIQYKGTYGTNGFYLTFGNTTSTTTLGYDSSPNGNNWTCNNISLTAGTTYDAMTDVPTNTSATVANYCVLSPISGSTNSVSNANLTTSNAGTYRIYGTFGLSSNKWYWEYTVSSIGSGVAMGISNNPSQAASDTNRQAYYSVDGRIYNDAGNTAYGNTYTTNDIIGIALDMDNGKLFFSKNGTWQNSGDPATGTNPAASSLTGTYYPFSTTVSCTINANFGQRPFSYTPPTGYVALNTYNLPTPTILQGNKYMDATLYTGTGTTQNIVNAARFKPDLVWTKVRNQAYGHALFDSVRGAGNGLQSNNTNAEDAWGSSTLASFNSNGFTAGADTAALVVNSSGNTFVGWQWQAGQGSTSSNTSGSITSTVSVNTTAGFSIATWTGTGSAATVGHGLGVAPSMFIVKARSAAGENWITYHKSIGTQYVILNGTNAAATNANIWNSAPTSSVISYGVSATSNAVTYVAYCWAEIAGFSRFGSYTGNGSADGPFVYTGFRPAYVLLKSATQGVGYDWEIYDNKRLGYNLTNSILYPDLSNAEATTAGIDILSNGFKLRVAGGNNNASGHTIIFAAFAEHPFKNSNSR